MRISELEEIMGAWALKAFLGEFGGMMIYVPRPGFLTAAHPLCGPAGFEAVYRLACAAGGGSLELPTLSRYRVMTRKREMVRRHSDGESFDTIARNMRISRRYVAMVISEWKDGRGLGADERDDAGTCGQEQRARQLELF